jgi:cytochrome c2
MHRFCQHSSKTFCNLHTLTQWALTFCLALPIFTAHAETSSQKSSPSTTIDAVKFSLHGNTLSTLALASDELGGVKSQEITIEEPHTQLKKTFVGVSIKALLDKVYGPKWKTEEEILVTCQDGYQPSIPVKKFLNNDAYLTWKFKNNDSFTIINTLQGNERITLAPFYLVWENIINKSIKNGGATDFPYQVVAIDLIKFKDKFGSLAPKSLHNKSIEEGFYAFRKYCLSCHAIGNGSTASGGQKGPDLAQINLHQRFPHAALQKWLLNPQAVKPGTTMPPLAPKQKYREKIADLIEKYLLDVIPKS